MTSRTTAGFRSALGAAALLAMTGCSPAQFRSDWSDDPRDTALVYGRIKLPEGCPRLVSVYQQLTPMLGWKGLGDPGVYDDGSFVVCDLPPGDRYFVPCFWIGDDTYAMQKQIKEFKLKAGQILYLGSWKVSNIKRGLILAGSFQATRLPDGDQAKILKTFLADPKVQQGRWGKKIKAELARLGGG